MASYTDSPDVEHLLDAIADETAPFMVVDLDRLEANVERFVYLVREHGTTLRPATKSIRVPGLIDRILTEAGEAFQGLMCYSPREAYFLAGRGFDNLLVAYPRHHETQIEKIVDMLARDIDVTLMIDEPAHLDQIATLLGDLDNPVSSLPVAVDVDVSYRPIDPIHLGVRRSPIRNLDDFRSLLDRIDRSGNLTFRGIMTYEAQIAGVPDRNPEKPWRTPFVKLIKWLSRRDVRNKRKDLVKVMDEYGLEGELHNGGGTGSLQWTINDPSLTEVTAGSGFLQSHLFDRYDGNENRAALFFGLPVTRRPEPGMVTCQSGGFIASGPAGADKTPVVVDPDGLETLSSEGFGEVQTPFRVPDHVDLEVGDTVLCRPAKAGEIAEHFDEYLLVRGTEIVTREKTYRGLGKNFY